MARGLGAVAAVLLVGAVAGAIYLACLELAPRSRTRSPDGQPKPDTASTASPSATVGSPDRGGKDTAGLASRGTKIAEPPEPAVRRTAFADYLLALTSPGWPKQAPAVRLSVACDAGYVLLAANPREKAAETLARSLADVERGRAAAPDLAALEDRLARWIEQVCVRESAQNPIRAASRGPRDKAGSQAPSVLPRATRPASRGPDPRPRLDAATAALEDQLAAEVVSGGLDPSMRLVLLDASVAPALPASPTRQAADRLIRAGRLLIRRLCRQGDARRAQELLDDASRRLDLAQREPNDTARLAGGLEALVEALGSKW
jgi:hypothetical protein